MFSASNNRWGITVLRVIVGFGFLAHGLAKWQRGPAGFAKLLAQIGVPLPLVSAWMVTAVEICGGLALLLGLFVAIASIPLIATLITAMFTVHWRYGFSSVNTIGLTPDGPRFGPPGYEIDLLYIAALLAVVFAGTSALSLDEWRARRHA
jgi:putative oxidoreductase